MERETVKYMLPIFKKFQSYAITVNETQTANWQHESQVPYSKIGREDTKSSDADENVTIIAEYTKNYEGNYHVNIKYTI